MPKKVNLITNMTSDMKEINPIKSKHVESGKKKKENQREENTNKRTYQAVTVNTPPIIRKLEQIPYNSLILFILFTICHCETTAF